MTLADAISGFLDHLTRNSSQSRPQLQIDIAERVLGKLAGSFSLNASLTDITPRRLLDSLARWYVDAASTAKPDERFPGIEDLLDTVSEFLEWSNKDVRSDDYDSWLAVVDELRCTLPRAMEITNLLSSWLAERGGAFGFPEFLTSFEEGGRSQYDIDEPDESEHPGVLEGYFRIIRVEGSSIGAEELISGRHLALIFFPEHIAALLEPEYIINLEVVRTTDGWKITGCGSAYPPGTEV